MADDYSEEVLEETPPRVAKFLNGIGAVAAVRTLLYEQAGMADDDIVEGRTLLLGCLAAPDGAAPEADTPHAKAQRAATAELDDWDGPNFTRYEATLRRRFPDQANYVFHKLAPSTGAEAVAGVAKFLQRVEALDSGTDERAKTAKQDKEAVKLLGIRGLPKKERVRLKELVDTALGPTQPLAPSAAPDTAANRREKLVDLKKWFDEWASAARVILKKRSYLIRLGLANRKAKKNNNNG